MIEFLQVGKLFNEGIQSYEEGALFDIDDCGCSLLLFLKNPNLKDIENVSEGGVKAGFYTEEEAIFMLFKLGESKWMDAPYSVHLSKNLTKFNDIPDGIGLGLIIYLIDACTGVLKSIKLVGLPTNFSRRLIASIEKQKVMPFANYNNKVKEIIMKYSIKKLFQYADITCNI